MQLEIRNSKSQLVFGLILCISALSFFLYCSLSGGAATGQQEFFWIPVGLLSLTCTCFLLEYVDKKPLHVFTEEGLSTKAKQTFLHWNDISSYKIIYTCERQVALQVLCLFDRNNKILLTLVLTGTDCQVESLETFLNQKLKRR